MEKNGFTKQYEITIENGAHPLTCKCSTIAEAYECLMGVRGWASHLGFDPDGLMEILVSMRGGKTLSHMGYGYRIEISAGGTFDPLSAKGKRTAFPRQVRTELWLDE